MQKLNPEMFDKKFFEELPPKFVEINVSVYKKSNDDKIDYLGYSDQTQTFRLTSGYGKNKVWRQQCTNDIPQHNERIASWVRNKINTIQFDPEKIAVLVLKDKKGNKFIFKAGDELRSHLVKPHKSTLESLENSVRRMF